MPKKTEIKDFVESESSYEESESSNDEQIEIQQEAPKPKKERKVRCDKKEKPPKQPYLFTEKRQANILKAIEVKKLKTEQRRKEKEEMNELYLKEKQIIYNIYIYKKCRKK